MLGLSHIAAERAVRYSYSYEQMNADSVPITIRTNTGTIR